MANGKLSLIGFGNSGAQGITLAGLEALKSCQEAFAEGYTNLAPEGTLQELEKLSGKKITLLGREQVESEKGILEAASAYPVALLVSGDPMIATTHVSLVLSAKKRGISVELFHAASILSSAIGESGLQAYKFGKMVTLAYWRENYKPMAAYDVISENLSRNLHTLLLLDIDEKLGPLRPENAAALLLEMEKEGKKGIFSQETKLVLLQGIGWGSQVKKYASISEILKIKGRKPGPPAIIIVPGKLHFLEEEFLQSF